ncbi:SemiSWEET family sugar transporter [Rubrimonas cliftonensis]|uniref:MtN3 and saliva related transmembrane protein n=1 Tax=Rubrimonas cliftonensis TaxID=89524 RepID=A0A1H4AK83_9RHOB|nr:PQ-loop domain-containing transporter [Rubrimonas cliftonensis]SEA36221.1 MtN3 and saliva related transmembrane protein [Rubrimonas cliftonensis]
MTAIDIVGYLAAALTTAAFAPQVWRTWRSGSARDLSLAMLLAQSSGNALWLAYALGAGAAPLALANGFTFMLVAALVAMKLADRPAAAPAPIVASAALPAEQG